MSARRAVLLIPFKSSHARQLLSSQQSASATPFFPALTKSVQLLHSIPFTRPLFSCSYALFCTHQKLNPFLFMPLRTPCQKHRGWGIPSRLHRVHPSRASSPGSFHHAYAQFVASRSSRQALDYLFTPLLHGLVGSEVSEHAPKLEKPLAVAGIADAAAN